MKVKLYSLLRIVEGKECYLTFTKNKKQCYEYMDRIIFIIHRDYFTRRAECHDFKAGSYEESQEAWSEFKSISDEYIKTVKSFYIRKLTYNLDGIACMMRMYANVVPVGASYETEQEFAARYTNLSDEKKKEIDDIVEKTLRNEQTN